MIGRIALIAVLLLSLLTVGQAAATSVHRASGNFSSDPVTGPECVSPVGLCTRGTLTGGLKGDFFFTATSLVSSVDTPTTAVVFYTGDITLATRDGSLTCKDAGAFQTTAPGAVSSVCVIVSGTGAFAGSAGTIQFVGNFTSPEGGDGDYRAEYTSP